MNNGWSVVPFEASDLPLLGKYFKRHFGGGGQYGSMSLFHWRAVENYVMPGIINLIKDNGRIVSTLSNTPKVLFVRGKAALVAEIGDANTDPEYQRQGMLTMLIKQSTQDALGRGIQGVYSTPSTTTPSLPAFVTKCNFAANTFVSIDALVLPLGIGSQLQKRGHGLLGRWADALIAPLLHLLTSLATRVVRPRKGCTIDVARELPEDWDDFWNTARSSYDYIFNRSREAFTWRYLDNPNTYRILLLSENGRTRGYLVYRIVPHDDVKRVMIADHLLVPGYVECLRPLVLHAIRDSLRLGADLISAWTVRGGRSHALLKGLGFLKKGAIEIVWYQNEFAAQVQVAGTWHMTMGDSDNV